LVELLPEVAFLLLRMLLQITKGQIKPKAGLAQCRFSQKTNEQICFVCCEKQKSKQNEFVRSFFGESTASQSAFGFI
jgi:hypothetical protein